MGVRGTECSVYMLCMFSWKPFLLRSELLGFCCWAQIYCDKMSQIICAPHLPSQQVSSQCRMCHAPWKCWLLRARHLCKHTFFPLQKQLFKLPPGRDDECYRTLWDSGCVLYHIVEVGLETCSWWCDVGMGMSVKQISNHCLSEIKREMALNWLWTEPCGGDKPDVPCYASTG